MLTNEQVQGIILSSEVIMKIEKKIELTEKNIKEIEVALKAKIKEIGSSEAGRIAGFSRQYMTDVINRKDRNLTYNQVIELAKK